MNTTENTQTKKFECNHNQNLMTWLVLSIVCILFHSYRAGNVSSLEIISLLIGVAIGITLFEITRYVWYKYKSCKANKLISREEAIKHIQYDEAIKYVKKSYVDNSRGMPAMLLGDVAHLIEITTGKKTNWQEFLNELKKQ